MKLKTLIADDEPLARERLRFLLLSDQEIEIAGECRNSREVISALRDNRIDLLFLDIQMPGGTGFDAFDQLGPARMPATVFVTAHDQYAIQAFEVSALDYLVKPVDPARLRSTVARAKEHLASQTALVTHEQLKAMLARLENGADVSKPRPKRFLVHNGTKDIFVNVDEIEWIEAADYYSCLHVGPRKLMLRETIKQLASTLDPLKFVRIHRSIIVNVDCLQEIVRDGQSEGFVVLTGGDRLKMSKAGWQKLLEISRS
jgi:two-component system, LytTR family, response regulator